MSPESRHDISNRLLIMLIRGLCQNPAFTTKHDILLVIIVYRVADESN